MDLRFRVEGLYRVPESSAPKHSGLEYSGIRRGIGRQCAGNQRVGHPFGKLQSDQNAHHHSHRKHPIASLSARHACTNGLLVLKCEWGSGSLGHPKLLGRPPPLRLEEILIYLVKQTELVRTPDGTCLAHS